jgi:hypothetical protein
MTYFETFNEMKNAIAVEQKMPKENYFKYEAKLTDVLCECIKDIRVDCKAHGSGIIISSTGETLNDLFVDIAFKDFTKQFSLLHIMTNKKFITLVDAEEFENIWSEAFEIHNSLTKTYKEYEASLKQMMIEAEKKAAAEKKAEETRRRIKEKAIRDFEILQNRTKEPITQADEFYYSLGWLFKHVGVISASMPDYLSSAFKKCFGNDAIHSVVDSTKRTINGYSMKWTFGFKATLRNAESIPAFLTAHLSSSGKAITSTSFIWDLVDDYGFQFGKKQDLDKIKQNIPNQYLHIFEAGMAA